VIDDGDCLESVCATLQDDGLEREQRQDAVGRHDKSFCGAAQRADTLRILNMRQWFMVSMAALTFAGASVGRAGDLGINVILSGQVAPGIYGQVQLGNASPPPLVYAQPMLIEPVEAPPPPVYLHVPPGHAKNWRKHCREYNACNRPVYFVRSAEYEPDYDRRRHDREDDQGRGHGHDEDHGHGHGHDKHEDH
jgi:hypothetical protein